VSDVIVVQNQFVAMLYDIKNKPGTERRVKDIYRAMHIINAWHNKANEGDANAKELLKELSALISSRVEKLNTLVDLINDKFEESGELPVTKPEKFQQYECKLLFDNPHNRALMLMLEAIDKTSTRMNILFWNRKFEVKKEYFELQKEVANPLRSVLQWVYKKGSAHS